MEVEGSPVALLGGALTCSRSWRYAYRTGRGSHHQGAWHKRRWSATGCIGPSCRIHRFLGEHQAQQQHGHLERETQMGLNCCERMEAPGQIPAGESGIMSNSPSWEPYVSQASPAHQCFQRKHRTQHRLTLGGNDIVYLYSINIQLHLLYYISTHSSLLYPSYLFQCISKQVADISTLHF